MKKNLWLLFLPFYITIVLVLILLYLMWSGISPSDINFITKEQPHVNATYIYMPQDMIDTLNSRYKSDVSEFIYCLKGNINQDYGYYNITDMIETEVLEAENDFIVYIECEKSYDNLGTIHSHPGGYCDFSRQDYYSFGSSGDLINGIICGKDKFVFIDYLNLYESMEVVTN